MSGFIEGENRHQSVLFPESLGDYAAEDSAVRVIDVFIDDLHISGLGFILFLRLSKYVSALGLEIPPAFLHRAQVVAPPLKCNIHHQHISNVASESNHEI